LVAKAAMVTSLTQAIIKVSRSLCKVPIIFVLFQRHLDFLDIFKQKTRSGGTELFHADWRTHRHQLIAIVLQNGVKKEVLLGHVLKKTAHLWPCSCLDSTWRVRYLSPTPQTQGCSLASTDGGASLSAATPTHAHVFISEYFDWLSKCRHKP
jgi:hypothetical protein